VSALRTLTVRVDPAKLDELRALYERCGFRWLGDELMSGAALDLGLHYHVDVYRGIAEIFERQEGES
jgi:hypothetical protein